MEYKEYENDMKFTRRHNEIEKAKEILSKHGYYVGNLYQADDVRTYFDCTDDEALDVLDKALDNDGTAGQIWMAIQDIGEALGLKEKED
jgi:hypothetical protein